MSDPTDAAVVEWTDALDALQRDLDLAEELLSDRQTAQEAEIVEWAVPELTTPLPAGLAERATELAARQQTLIEQLPDAIAAVRRQSSVSKKMNWSARSAGQASVYVDTTV
ncbi:MAG: hypothetical protein ACXVWW_02165 [Nocardioides sp.]